MSILFAGTELDAFLYIGTPVITTTAGYFDATYVRGATYFPGDAPAYGIEWAPASDTWLRFSNRLIGSNASTAQVALVDASNVPLARLAYLNNVPTFQYWDGSAWVTVATIPQETTLTIFDIQYRNTVSGRIAFYLNNVEIGEVLGDFSALASPVNVQITNRPTNGFYISQVIVADEPTLGFKLAYRQPTGAGFYTAWDGTWDEVDAASPTDSSFVASDTDGERESFVRAAFSVPVAYRVKAVAATARVRRGETGPSQVELMLRFGSTNYDSGVKALELGFTPVQHFWHTNPATTLEWTPADAGSATVEFGLKAVT